MHLSKGLIVSCQALKEEPLHSSFIMSKMALAAKQGGAVGIRANSKKDIQEIKKEVNLPIIGIVKQDYIDSEVFITASKKEVDELLESGCEVIAMDSTKNRRPKETLKELVSYIRNKKTHIELMADCATVEEADIASKLHFDYIATTLHGYTKETKGKKISDNNFEFVRELVESFNIPIIAEGNILNPAMYQKCLNIGAYSCVVGGAITRPQQITRRFVDFIE